MTILKVHYGPFMSCEIAEIYVEQSEISYLGAEIWVPKDEVHDANKKLNLTVGWLSTGKCLMLETIGALAVTARIYKPSARYDIRLELWSFI